MEPFRLKQDALMGPGAGSNAGDMVCEKQPDERMGNSHFSRLRASLSQK